MFAIDFPLALTTFFGLIFVFIIAKNVPKQCKRHLYRIRGSRKDDQHVYVERREQREPWEMGKRDWRKDDCGVYTWDTCPARQRRMQP